MMNLITERWKKADSAEHKMLITLCVIVSALLILLLYAA